MALYLLILLSISMIGIGAVAIMNNPKGNTNRYFFIFLISASFWILSNYLSNNLTSYDAVLWANRFIFTSTTILAWALLLFSRSYPNTKLVIEKRLKNLIDIATFLLALLTLTPLLVESVEIQEGHSEIVFGAGIAFYLVYFVIYLGLAIYTLLKKYQVSKGLEKIKLQYLFFGLLMSAIGATLTNLLLPVFFDIYTFTDVGPLFLLIFVAFTFVSIVRHRLFGIKFLIGTIVTNAILALFLVFLFILIYFIQINLWGSLLSPASIVTGFIYAFTFVPIFVYMEKYLRREIFNSFGYEESSYEEAKNSIVSITSTSVDLDEISTRMSNLLSSTLEVETTWLAIIDNKGRTVIESYLHEGDPMKNVPVKKVLDMYKNSSQKGKLMVVQELEYSHLVENEKNIGKIVDELIKADIEVMYSVDINRTTSVVFFFGPKYSKQAFTVQDINLIKYFGDISSSAFGRALLYKRVQDFNVSLQRKVDQATYQLQDKVELLEEARRKERDMMDIMGHELRTPLSIIKIKQSLLHKKASEDPRNFTVDDFLDVDKSINEALEREIELLETMLSSTKIDAGKIDIVLEEVPLKNIIDASILGHKSNAEKKKLQLKVDKYDKKIAVFADKIRLGEVLDNFVSNAIKYTDKGSVTICVKENNGDIEVCVIDTGIGIPKKAMKRLGEKFFRVNQYISHDDEDDENNIVRPGGTGLGLYVTFGLIEMMGGKVKVESELGKGSTFSFTVPRYTGQKAITGDKKARNVFERMDMEKKDKKRK
jgi:signal transduction histidine kinase